MAYYNEKPDPILFNRIYVGYGVQGITESQWRELFSCFGTIRELYTMRNKKGQDQGNVFISYTKTSEACLAVEAMNGQPISDSPRKLKVEIAKSRDKADVVELNYDHADDTNYLQRIQFNCGKPLEARELKEYFSEFGLITKIYIVKDKRTGASRGRGWLRFSKQSEAAYAIEQADPSYNVDWSDVRRQGAGSSYNQDSWAPRGSGGNRVKYKEDGNLDYHSLTGITEADLDFMPGFEPEDQNVGPDHLEAITPPGMTREMAKQLFDMIPAMVECKLDTRTGIAKIKYESPRCAAYAKDKLDGFSYAGLPLQVKFGKVEEVVALRETAAELKSTMDTLLQNGTSDTARLTSIMQSLQMVTDTLRQKGVSVEEKPKAKDIPWCSAALPPRKPMLPQITPVVGRLFFVATPDAFFDKILLNVFCRFGNLIRANFEKGKRFGFAHYASQESADAARRTLHGHYIFSSKMKVEYASAPTFKEDYTNENKKQRML